MYTLKLESLDMNISLSPHRLWPQLFLPLWYLSVAILSLAVFISFAIFAPFSYGYPSLTFDQILWRRWVETWDLLYRT